jgi:RNA polymerase sigma-70 factor, ECF subfamily
LGESGLLEHLFRQESGRLTARLTRLLGAARLELAEESVQEAMVRALQTWPYAGAPENPRAWLFRVAHNAAIDALRRDHTAGEKAAILVSEILQSSSAVRSDPETEERLRDDELRMIIMCCHPDLSRDARVALSLKIVGGFGTREIARAFLLDEATIAQRLVRAKRQIRDSRLTLEVPQGSELQQRLDSLVEVLYFMFNEGYTSHEGEDLSRHDLCMEAIRLGRMVASSSISKPKVDALVALMAFQAARLPARVDDSGNLILLDSQDREKWDHALIALGFHHFDRSIRGEEVSSLHVEAAIAATHARAVTPESTDWPLILEMYDQLFLLNPSPVVTLNRAVAVGKVLGAERALALLEPLETNLRLQDYYLLAAVRGHLLLELGRTDEADACYRTALEQRCSEPERRFLKRRLEEIGGDLQ